MSEQIVVVTYKGDLPQFKLMLYCLNKYWQGNKQITIAVTSYNNEPATVTVPQVEEVLHSQLSLDWTIHVFPEIKCNIGGYNEAQLYKFLISKSNLADDHIILDCKDFLLKPADFTDFIFEGRYKIIHFDDPEKTYQEIYPLLTTQLGITQDIPKNIILTPYIFNNNQMKRVWTKFINKFGNYDTWTTFPTMIECGSYYALTYLDESPLIKFVDKSSPEYYWMPIGGIWKSQTREEILEQQKTFDLFPERKFWKHHRNVFDSTEITADVLQQHNIPDAVINTWIFEKSLTKI